MKANTQYMKTTQDPFEDLKNTLTDSGVRYGDGSIIQKAFFEDGSHESNAISRDKRIAILSKFVFDGYSMHTIIHRYLVDKGDLDDIRRIFSISSTFKTYTDTILEKGGSLDEVFQRLVIGDENKTPKEELRDAINEFESAVKRVFKSEDFVESSKSEIENKNYCIKDLLRAYVTDDFARYIDISNQLHIDLEEDLTLKLKKRDEDEDTEYLWRYVALYEWYKIDLLGRLRNNYLADIDLEPEVQMPNVAIYEVLKKIYYPQEYHERIKTDDNFRQECILDFAERVVSVLWQDKPLFDQPVYFVRCNYTGLHEKYIDDLFKQNTISICIQDHEKEDQDYYNKSMSDEKVKHNKELLYIDRFTKMAKLAQETDILVVAAYAGLNTKIGLLKKGSVVRPDRKESDELTLYCFDLKSVYCNPITINQKIESVDLREYPLLKALVPSTVTVSPIKKRAKAIYSIYYGMKYPLELSLLSDEALEVMCTEYLRSRFSNDPWKIYYQITKTGGNLADVDIVGINKDNERVVAQVTSTKDLKLVEAKTKKLQDFPAERKIIFSLVGTDLFMNDCLWIDLAQVFGYFKNDKLYKTLLERLAQA